MIPFAVLTSIVAIVCVFTLSAGFVNYRGRRSRYDDEYKAWFIGSAAAFVLTAILVICMFNIEEERIDSNNFLVSFECTKVRIAEYSDTYVTTCNDSDGDPYPCTETRHWTKPASEVIWTRMKTNPATGEQEFDATNAHQYNIKLITIGGGLIIPADPPVMWSVSRIDFDGFVVRTTMDYTMHIRLKSGLWVNDSISRSSYFKALDDLKYERFRVIERLGDWVITNNTYEKEDKTR